MNTQRTTGERLVAHSATHPCTLAGESRERIVAMIFAAYRHEGTALGAPGDADCRWRVAAALGMGSVQVASGDRHEAWSRPPAYTDPLVP